MDSPSNRSVSGDALPRPTKQEKPLKGSATSDAKRTMRGRLVRTRLAHGRLKDNLRQVREEKKQLLQEVEYVKQAKEGLKDEIRRLTADSTVSTGSREALGALVSDDPERRKELVRLLREHDLHVWSPHDARDPERRKELVRRLREHGLYVWSPHDVLDPERRKEFVGLLRAHDLHAWSPRDVGKPARRKELLRFLHANGLHIWTPRDAWGSDSERAFRETADAVIETQRTLLSYDRLYTLWQSIKNLRDIEAIAEVGVFKGGTSAFIARAFLLLHGNLSPMYAIDTFEGHRDGDIEEFETQVPQEFSGVEYQDVKRHLSEFPQIEVVKAAFADAVPRLAERRYSLVHVDTDLYRPTRECLEYFNPLLVAGGTIVVDDYMAPSCTGVTRAVQEFLVAHPHYVAWGFMTEQAVIVRRETP